jgi:hypothetical protein
MVHRVSHLVLVACVAAGSLRAQTNHVDVVTPSAPELAAFGKYTIGVRTLQVTDSDRPDILNTKEGGPTARYHRTLTVEVWYPAVLAVGQTPGGEYHTVTRDPAIATTLHGKAVRDAAPLATDGPFPLVIVAGYPGNRFLMSHFRRTSPAGPPWPNRSPDSTYDDQKAFGSNLQPPVRSIVRAERNGSPGRRAFSFANRRREPRRHRRGIDGRLWCRQRHRWRLPRSETFSGAPELFAGARRQF